jgi:hypothetical protein
VLTEKVARKYGWSEEVNCPSWSYLESEIEKLKVDWRGVEKLERERDEWKAKAEKAEKAEAEVSSLERILSERNIDYSREHACRKRLARALDKAVLALAHTVPNDCYSTGPLTGTAMDKTCVACDAEKQAGNSLAESAALDKEGEP